MGNQLKTAVLLGVLTALIIMFGSSLGGQNGMMIAFVFALGMNFFSYWFSDKIVLKMYKAQEVSEAESPELFSIVHRLTSAAGIPMPKLYIIPEDSPNAFATGRNPEHAAVAVTQGILRLLSRDELEGVLAHELAHVKNRDILIGTVAAVLAGVITYIAHMAQWAAMFGGFSRDDDEDGGGSLIGTLILAIVAPIAALLIQMAISRSREYLADESGARFAGTPTGLAGALEKLDYASQRVPLKANPATENMFIVKPFTGGGIMNLFSTHPPIGERIQRLRAMR
ncbi:MAG: zinc metalloprotease HtpX [Deltaproteobacteria bacterium]|nr:zinc metalloprotease HtpX [Deltaproteobacteria bacterium]